MKKIILLVSVVLFGCVGYAQAQTSEKKLSRQERKEAKRAMEQALFEEAKQAIENKSLPWKRIRLSLNGAELHLSLQTQIL